MANLAVTVRLSAQAISKLEQKARAEKIPRSTLMREIICRYLGDQSTKSVSMEKAAS
jgi:predicted DNA binding CopG/RHH family protein